MLKDYYLPISDLSLMGSCETKFLKAVLGELEFTTYMKEGVEGHLKLLSDLKPISRTEALEKIKSGEKFSLREVFVLDKKFKTMGSIDELRFTGKLVNGKAECIIIEDKFPKNIYKELPLTYKIQITAYFSALRNSSDFSNFCDLVGAKVFFRDKVNLNIIKSFTIRSEVLKSWEKNLEELIEESWKVYNSKKPEHKRFDIVNKKWIDCYCELK